MATMDDETRAIIDAESKRLRTELRERVKPRPPVSDEAIAELLEQCRRTDALVAQIRQHRRRAAVGGAD